MKHIINNNGDEYWFDKKNQSHRDHGPSIIWNEGSEWWYKNDYLHRENGPSFIHINGKEKWSINGKFIDETLHR